MIIEESKCRPLNRDEEPERLLFILQIMDSRCWMHQSHIWKVFARHGMGNSATGNNGTTHNAATDMPASCAVYEGYLDGADCSQIWGWAWDQNNPNTPINVDIYDGASYIATVAANLFRQDLLNAGKGNGSHAFVYNVPSFLKDGQTHSITAKFGGTTTSLSSTPRSIICGASLFPTQLPQATATGGGSTWEQGTQFSSSISGKITHIRFYKASGETGTHVGRIWSDTGTLLAQVTFTGESGSGWQTQTLPTPLPITSGVRYRVTYNVSIIVAKTFSALPVSSGPLTAWGSFFSTPAGSFPTSGSSSNLFGDILFNSPQ